MSATGHQVLPVFLTMSVTTTSIRTDTNSRTAPVEAVEANDVEGVENLIANNLQFSFASV